MLDFLRSCSSTLPHISHILRLRARVKMLRPATFWIIAFVENIEAVGYRAEMKLVGYTMRLFYFLMRLAADSNFPISGSADSRLPFPTRSGIIYLGDFLPEPLMERLSLNIRRTRITATFLPWKVCLKFLMAGWARFNSVSAGGAAARLRAKLPLIFSDIVFDAADPTGSSILVRHVVAPSSALRVRGPEDHESFGLHALYPTLSVRRFQ